MSTTSRSYNIIYSSTTLKEEKLSTFLGVTLDRKFNCKGHIEKGTKRLSRLKQLTATTWSGTKDLLSTPYKTYIQPAMEDGSEVAHAV